jgi:hypothetical protein
MKAFFLISCLMMPTAFSQALVQDPQPAEDSLVVIVNFKWSRDRQQVANAVRVSNAPAPAMIAANKNFEKQRRINASAGERDPNQDSVDGRSAELERIVQQSREPEPVSGFTYQVKLQNSGSKPIQNIFWEYQFKEVANPANLARRQFLCSASIKPENVKELKVFSLLGPSNVVDVKSLGKGADEQFLSAVLINRVEYVDGTFWQRPGWDVNDFKLMPKARSATRNMPVCRSI